MKLSRSLARLALSACFVFLARLTLSAEENGSASFLRSVKVDQLNALQTLSREYRPESGAGPAIWLIGVAHIGTPEYYAHIQARLNERTVVLFEGVGDGSGQFISKTKRQQSGDAKSEDDQGQPPGIQQKLASALGLKFQLDAIDYQRPNFVNSDVTLNDLKQAVTDQQASSPKKRESTPAPKASKNTPTNPFDLKLDEGELFNDQTFDMLVQGLEGRGPMDSMVNQFTTLVNSSPQMRETTKVILVEALGQAGDIIQSVSAASPAMKSMFEVLITKRNEAVARDLQKRLGKLGPNDSIAIFYGAAHLDDIAAHLGHDFHYVPAKDEWDTAFTADPAKSAIPEQQLKAMLQMVKAQLKKGPAKPKNPAVSE